MTPPNTGSTITSDPTLSAIAGFVIGGIQAVPLQQTLNIANRYGLPTDDITAAGNYVTARAAIIAIVIAGMEISQQGTAFAPLKRWKEANGGGCGSVNELFTTDAGVTSIATGYTAVNQTDVNGNITQQTGTFTKTDDGTGNSADIWLKVDKTYTLTTDWLPETAAIAALPDLQGFGNVRDLHQAMLRDTVGHLQDFCFATNDVMFDMKKVG